MQHLSFLAVHTNPFAGSSYCGDDACGARKKATTDWPSEMSNRSSLKVILYTVLAHLLLQRAVLGKGKTLSVELLLLCTGGDTADPHRAVVAVGDQCLRVNVLENGSSS